MTTAHRPTWNAAQAAGGANDKGNYSGSGQISAQFSSKDLPGQLTMKMRSTPLDSREQMLAKLRAKEEEHFKKKNDGG